MQQLLIIATAILAGLMMSRVVKLVKLPAVTGYLIVGILLGPFCLGSLGIDGLGFTSAEQVKGFSVMSETALGFIAFAIGNEFRLSALKKTGKQATIIGIIQALVATAAVDIALVIVHLAMPDRFPLPAAIILGAIASATAPATTLMVVRQYKAKGEVTDLLLPIVALDDAVGLIVFAISFGVAKTLVHGNADVVSIIVEPLAEIVLSLGLGAALGAFLTFFERFFHSRSKRLSLAVAFVLVAAGISMLTFTVGGLHFGFSSLLVCMMMGTVFCNMCDFSEELMDRTDRWTAPLFILFFVLSGAELNLTVLTDAAIVIVGLIYIIFRSGGKYFGSYFSAAASGCSKNVQKYLGIMLLPQEGVALGMSLKAEALGETGTLVRNIVLFSVLVYELLGPVMTKIALTKAGEIKPGAVSARGQKV